MHWWSIPVWATLFFIIVSFFVHKYLRNRLKPILVWPIIGIIAVTAWSICWQVVAWQGGPPPEQQALTNDLNSLLSRGAFYNMITSHSIFQDWIICLVLAIGLNLIYGTVIQLSTPLYNRKTIG